MTILKNEIKKDFDFLRLYEFKSVKTRKYGFVWVYGWARKNIGVEVEVDVRECDLFLLISKVNNFKLPAGYYVNNGEKVRTGIKDFLKKNNIDYDKKSRQRIKFLYQQLKYNRSEIILRQLSKENALLLKSALENMSERSLIDSSILVF